MGENEIILIENFISKQYQQVLLSFIENGDLPLYYNSNTIGPYKLNYPEHNVIEYPQFTHAFVSNGNVASDFWVKFEPIVFNFLAKTEINFGKLIRCKLNLNPKIEKATPREHFTIHTDSKDVEGFTAIYYINDSDGETLFFNKTGTEIIKKISPKQGSMVYFNNKIPHAGQPPKNNNYRSVINFNWIK